MKIRKQSGFTLVEVIVVAGIIAILAGVLVPLILKEIDEARITRAYADARSLSSAIIVLKKDAGKWPNLSGTCVADVTLLHGDGAIPGDADTRGFVQTKKTHYNDFLTTDATGCIGTKWKGPYMAHASMDPWGNAFITNADGFASPSPVWIISAGPNGVIETNSDDQTLLGDDVGIRLH